MIWSQVEGYTCQQQDGCIMLHLLSNSYFLYACPALLLSELTSTKLVNFLQKRYHES
jgi:hypothetical protein